MICCTLMKLLYINISEHMKKTFYLGAKCFLLCSDFRVYPIVLNIDGGLLININTKDQVQIYHAAV